jgi:hypothetical protein
MEGHGSLKAETSFERSERMSTEQSLEGDGIPGASQEVSPSE